MNTSTDQASAANYTGRVHVTRLRLNRSGYDASGCYWGAGGKLFNVWDDDGLLDYHFRAIDREDALWRARKRYPLAKIHGLPDPVIPGASSPVTFWEVETTDTFAGEANYSWARRVVVCTPADTDMHKHRVLRMLRAAAGLTGQRTRFADLGDLLEWRYVGACIVTFAVPRY
jgi:hypothetical protein